MRLIEVTVQNYRSITALTRFEIGDLTTLVGPNNEGKSNLLRAVAVGMDFIERWAHLRDGEISDGVVQGVRATSLTRPRRLGVASQSSYGYRWSDDFPLAKQSQRGARPTFIRLKFRLDGEEIAEYQDAIGLSNNSDLPIDIKLGRTSASLGIAKPGRGAASYKAKSREIARFISDRISLVSVPAIRTGEQAIGLVNQLTRIRLRSLLESTDYKQLTEKLNALRGRVVSEVSEELTRSVKRYIPSVASVALSATEVERSNSVEELLVDDGTATSIESKGDGIKSLVTMALVQELAREKSRGHNFILAVDEPEAHLHHASVHELQVLFQQLAQDQQVILATHNPVFVNRDRAHSNILVRGNTASIPKSLVSIREALGVELHDNLSSAETVVLVEGISDEKILPELLAEVDDTLRTDVSSGSVVFRATKGAGKMRAQVQREKSTVCRIVAVLDGDAEGKAEAKRIIDAHLLPEPNVFVLGRSRMQVEVEDLVVTDVYLDDLSAKFGRRFTEAHFSDRSRKWSANFEEAATNLGIVPHEGLIDDAKAAVSNSVQAHEGPALRGEFKEIVKALSALVRNDP